MKDYGADPIGNGMFKMIPSGDIVTMEEKNKRLPLKPKPPNDCCGLSWGQIEAMQGGKLRN